MYRTVLNLFIITQLIVNSLPAPALPADEEEAYRYYQILREMEESFRIKIANEESTSLRWQILNREPLLRFCSSLIFRRLVVSVILLHALLFGIVESGLLIGSARMKADIVLEHIEISTMVFYVMELGLQLMCFGTDYLVDMKNLIDTFLILCNVIQHFRPGPYLHWMTYLRFFRIFRILSESWLTLSMLAIAILDSLTIFITTVTVFMAIFIYFVLLSHKLFGHLVSFGYYDRLLPRLVSSGITQK